MIDRKSTRLNSSHTEIYTLSLHDALPIFSVFGIQARVIRRSGNETTKFLGQGARLLARWCVDDRSEEHTSELQSHRDLHSFPTRRSSDLFGVRHPGPRDTPQWERDDQVPRPRCPPACALVCR